ncbi:MAG TPA: Hsp20/alpha crystallin family protein [Solirubrobacteraceae bacterium]|jgi:HSP20 family protein|nr:Hsp20/alpha crystallin family protein [Solirubrobacteraceae bacterium]
MPLPVRRRDTAPQPTARWNPFGELEGLQEQLAQLMQHTAQDGNGAAPFIPLVDIEETEDAWIVEAELPGVRKEDVNVEMRGSELAISGEIKEREREGILRRRMRKTGEFDYHVTLPGDADAERIEARLEDGVLTVRIPKPEEQRSRRIDVQAD